MNFKRKWLFVLPLVVLSAALGWVKWTRDNPTPTARDLQLRQQFVKAGKVIVINKHSHFTHLSVQQRREIAEHINIIWSGPAPTMVLQKTWHGYVPTEDITIWWGKAKGTHIVNSITLGPTERTDYDRYTDNVGQFLPLHPATSRFLRQWIAKHPEIQTSKN